MMFFSGLSRKKVLNILKKQLIPIVKRCRIMILEILTRFQIQIQNPILTNPILMLILILMLIQIQRQILTNPIQRLFQMMKLLKFIQQLSQNPIASQIKIMQNLSFQQMILQQVLSVNLIQTLFRRVFLRRVIPKLLREIMRLQFVHQTNRGLKKIRQPIPGQLI